MYGGTEPRGMAQAVNTLLLIALVGAGALVVGGVFVWALGRAAAIGDRKDSDMLSGEGIPPLRVVRAGPADRRTSSRPWAAQSPGRRSGDALRSEVEEARQALVAAEAELASYEARHGNDAA